MDALLKMQAWMAATLRGTQTVHFRVIHTVGHPDMCKFEVHQQYCDLHNTTLDITVLLVVSLQSTKRLGPGSRYDTSDNS